MLFTSFPQLLYGSFSVIKSSSASTVGEEVHIYISFSFGLFLHYLSCPLHVYLLAGLSACWLSIHVFCLSLATLYFLIHSTDYIMKHLLSFLWIV